jgi:hypothetical protein
VHSLYTLTAMTGREASAKRTVVIGTFEFNRRVWLILAAAFPAAVLVMAILWMFVGQLALVTLPVVEVGAVWLFHMRSNSGLRLRTYQAIWDKRTASVDEFVMCGQPIDVSQSDFRRLMQNTAPYTHQSYTRQASANQSGSSPEHRNDEKTQSRGSNSPGTRDNDTYPLVDGQVDVSGMFGVGEPRRRTGRRRRIRPIATEVTS